MIDSTSSVFSFPKPSRWQRFKCWLGLHPVECIIRDPLDVKIIAGTARLEWCPACGHAVYTNPTGVRYIGS